EDLQRRRDEGRRGLEGREHAPDVIGYPPARLRRPIHLPILVAILLALACALLVPARARAGVDPNVAEVGGYDPGTGAPPRVLEVEAQRRDPTPRFFAAPFLLDG